MDAQIQKCNFKESNFHDERGGKILFLRMTLEMAEQIEKQLKSTYGPHTALERNLMHGTRMMLSMTAECNFNNSRSSSQPQRQGSIEFIGSWEGI
jgi:hypothetical protein